MTVEFFLFSLGEAPFSGPATLQLQPSGGGASWAGVRPELSGPLRSSGHSCPAKNSAGPSLQHPDPRTGTSACLVGTFGAASGKAFTTRLLCGFIVEQ